MIHCEDAERFVREWFGLADSHASVAELLARVDMGRFLVCFGEQRLNCVEYADWYVNDIRSYFDSEHRIVHMDVAAEDGRAVVTNQVHWSGRCWTPPAAKSCLREVDCVIRFTIEEKADGGLALLKYESL